MNIDPNAPKLRAAVDQQLAAARDWFKKADPAQRAITMKVANWVGAGPAAPLAIIGLLAKLKLAELSLDEAEPKIVLPGE